jgi:hypothetical protein
VARVKFTTTPFAVSYDTIDVLPRNPEIEAVLTTFEELHLRSHCGLIDTPCDAARSEIWNVPAGVLAALRLEHIAGSEQQDQPEQVENPREGVDQRGAEEDEAGTCDQGEHDSEQQYLARLILADSGSARADQYNRDVSNDTPAAGNRASSASPIAAAGVNTPRRSESLSRSNASASAHSPNSTEVAL